MWVKAAADTRQRFSKLPNLERDIGGDKQINSIYVADEKLLANYDAMKTNKKEMNASLPYATWVKIKSL